MHAQQSHVIKRQILEVEISEKKDHTLSEDLTQLFYYELKPKLEQLMDRLAPRDIVFNLDHLHLDLGVIPASQLTAEFSKRFLDELEKKVQQLTVVKHSLGSSNHEREENVGAVSKSRSAQLEEAFFFFVEKGRLPWWFQVDSIEDFEAQLKTLRPQDLLRVLKKSEHSARVCRRIVAQFSSSFISVLVESILPKRATMVLVHPVKDKVKVQILRLILTQGMPLLEHAITNNKTEKTAQVLKKIKSLLAKASEDEKITDKAIEREVLIAVSSSRKLALEVEEMYVHNAGVVLLWPFLDRFFSALGLVQQRQFKDRAAQERAILLIEYLATSHEKIPEYDLVLPKLLCNFPLDEPIVNHLALSTKEVEESEKLLGAVVNHWGTLKNTSPLALQEAFLQRDGKLSQVSNGWSLQVEQKGYDVLLGDLPWGIGLVQLGWMGEMVIVEWN